MDRVVFVLVVAESAQRRKDVDARLNLTFRLTINWAPLYWI